MTGFNRATVVGLAFGLLVLAGQQAQAGPGRSIRVDAGDANFPFSGEIWTDRTEVDFSTDPVITGTMPFALNFSGAAGAGAVYDFSFYANATVPAGLDIGTGDFASGNFGSILPYFIALPNLGSVTFGAGEWSIGEVDTVAPYARADTFDAVRFTWRDGVTSDGTVVAAQLVFLSRGAGDFDIEFNYGFGSLDFPAGGSQSLKLGPTGQHVESLGEVGFYGACYRGGVADICSPAVAAVPEPATVSLFALGFALLAVWAQRRRQRLTAGLAKAAV